MPIIIFAPLSFVKDGLGLKTKGSGLHFPLFTWHRGAGGDRVCSQCGEGSEIDVPRPVWGTCAAPTFLSKDVPHHHPLPGLMASVVRRNAFGRQVDSFEFDPDVPALAAVCLDLGRRAKLRGHIPFEGGLKAIMILTNRTGVRYTSMRVLFLFFFYLPRHSC